jgi:hypothetical protein
MIGMHHKILRQAIHSFQVELAQNGLLKKQVKSRIPLTHHFIKDALMQQPNFSFCGFRGKHRPAISIAGYLFTLA